jgi:hypothetical protein
MILSAVTLLGEFGTGKRAVRQKLIRFPFYGEEAHPAV